MKMGAGHKYFVCSYPSCHQTDIRPGSEPFPKARRDKRVRYSKNCRFDYQTETSSSKKKRSKKLSN